jgi:hypothetical protein
MSEDLLAPEKIQIGSMSSLKYQGNASRTKEDGSPKL